MTVLLFIEQSLRRRRLIIYPGVALRDGRAENQMMATASVFSTMSEHKGTGPQPPDNQPAPESDKPSGRAGFDERGNSVWEWRLETGVYSRDVSTQELKKLELGELSIAETAIHKRPPGAGDAGNAPPPGGGSNPYDNVKSGGKLQPAQPTPPRKPVDMKKLNEWIRLRKQVEEQKDRDDD